MNKVRPKPATPIREAAIYLQIAAKIQEQLRTGRFKKGEKLPSIRALSSTFKVNYLTARQALKQLESQGLVQMETGRGTFVVEPRAKPQTIGVVVPDLSYKVNSGISRGIREESAGRNVVPIFMDFHNDMRAEKRYLERLQSEQFAGALVYPSLEEETSHQLLKMVLNGFPIVFLDRAPLEMPSWLVSSDDYEIGRLAASHLIEAGCVHLACLGSPAPNLQKRVKGFVDEANNRGMAIPSERIPIVDHIPVAASQQITDQLMNLRPRPDGIFYFNDQYALVGLRRLHDLGIEVPGQVRIVGCDNIEAALHSRPTLTTVSQNPMELGHKAFSLLTEMIQGPTEDRLTSRHFRVPVELIARESTAR